MQIGWPEYGAKWKPGWARAVGQQTGRADWGGDCLLSMDSSRGALVNRERILSPGTLLHRVL